MLVVDKLAHMSVSSEDRTMDGNTSCEEALPVSCFSSDAPDSPLQGSSLCSASRASSLDLNGHILADRSSFEEISLCDPKERALSGASSGVLNSKLAKLLERRRAREAEQASSLRADHAAEIASLRAEHRDALEMKDVAHRSVMDDMVAELQALRQQLAAADRRWEAADAAASALGSELSAERGLRETAERELKGQLVGALDRWQAAEEQAQRLREELRAERAARAAAEAETRALHSMLEAELEAV